MVLVNNITFSLQQQQHQQYLVEFSNCSNSPAVITDLYQELYVVPVQGPVIRVHVVGVNPYCPLHVLFL